MAKKKRDFSPKQLHAQDLWSLRGAFATLRRLATPRLYPKVQLFQSEFEKELQNLLDNTNHYDRK